MKEKESIADGKDLVCNTEKGQKMKVYAWNIGMAATIPSNNGYNLALYH